MRFSHTQFFFGFVTCVISLSCIAPNTVHAVPSYATYSDGEYLVMDFSSSSVAIWADITYGSAWTRNTSTWLAPGEWQEIAPTKGVQFLTGSSFDDYLRGEGRNNWLQGGSGDDMLVYTGAFDYLWGDSGKNTASFAYLTQPVWVDLAYKGNEAWVRSSTLASGTWKEIADLQNIRNIIDTSFNDELYGDVDDNTFYFTDGFDTIDGRGGFNTVDFSKYKYAVWYHQGYTASSKSNRTASKVAGEAIGSTWFTSYWSDATHDWAGPPNVLVNSKNVQNIVGTDYDDLLASGTDTEMDPAKPRQNNTIDGRGGNDRLSAFGGDDTLLGGAGADTFVFKPHYDNDTIKDWNAQDGDQIEYRYGASGFISHEDVMAALTVKNISGRDALFIQAPDGTIQIESNTKNLKHTDLPKSAVVFTDAISIGAIAPDNVTVDFAGVPGNKTDWIGVYATGETDDKKFVSWLYTDGTKVGTLGITNGSVTLSDINFCNGSYEARLFYNDSFVRVTKVRIPVPPSC